MKILFWMGYQTLLDSRRGAIIGKDLSSDPLTGFACLDKLVQLSWKESRSLLRLVEAG